MTAKLRALLHDAAWLLCAALALAIVLMTLEAG